MKKDNTIHLLASDVAQTFCGLKSADLPREQVTGLTRKANCQACHKAAIEQMYANYEANTAPPIRRA